MADVLTFDQRHNNLVAIRSSSTKPEMKLRRALWQQGFRFRVNDVRLPGKPDILLPKYRTAIFVNGCFWHGHKNCKHFTIPKSNTDFWVAKIARNQERDQEVWRRLEAKGWYVIIVWECELSKKKLPDTVERVVEELHKNRESYQVFQNERRKVREEYRIARKIQLAKEESLLLGSKSIIRRRKTHILESDD